jgi:hypothetical protein
MTCDRYKNALLSAAANNEKLDTKLANHVAHCQKCYATLRSRRDLFSQIDAALRARVNEDLRPGFLARVRVQLSKESPARGGSNPASPVVGAALALLLVAMFYPWVNVKKASVEGNLQAPRVSVPQISAEAGTVVGSSRDLGRQRRHSSKHPNAKSPSPQKPEVLVPPDEQKAFAQFVARVEGRDVIAEAVLSPAVNKTLARTGNLPEIPSVDRADRQLDRWRTDEWQDENRDSE